MGQNFRRTKQGDGGTVNAALNYGYSIVRSLVARYVSVSGMNPVFGFGHSNLMNPLCLVDDLIEPFRPVVDLHVRRSVVELSEWGPEVKRTVLSLLDCKVELDGKAFGVSAAAWELVSSLPRVCESQDPELLRCPKIRTGTLAVGSCG